MNIGFIKFPDIGFIKFPDDGGSVWVIRQYDRFNDVPLDQSGYHLMIKTLIDEYNEEYRGECQLEGRYFVKIGMSGDHKFNDGSREKYCTVVCKPAEAPVFTFMSSGKVLYPEEVRKVAFHTTFVEEELIHAFDVPHLTAIEMIRILGMGNESIGIKFNGDGVVVKHAVPSSFTMEML